MSGDHLERLEAALHGPRRVHHVLGEPHPLMVLVDEPDLLAAVAELKRLRAVTTDSGAMWLAERNEELRDAVTVAAEMLHRFAAETPCTEGGDTCREHGYARKPCLHALARQFVTAWRAVQAEAAPQQPALDGGADDA